MVDIAVFNSRRCGLQVKRIVNTFFFSNTYVLSMKYQDSVWLVDCGDWWHVKKFLNSHKVKGVLVSHTHADHIYGLNEMLADFPDAVIYTNQFGVHALSDAKLNLSKYHENVPNFELAEDSSVVTLEEGSVVELFKGVRAEVLSVPGHDKSCLAYIVGKNLFTGDSYIPNVKLIAHFPNSNKKDAKDSYDRLEQMSKYYMVRAGH